MMTLRLKQVFVLAAILGIAACKTASSDKPAPPVPAASPAPVSLPLPASAPAPVSGAPTSTPPSSGSPAPTAGTPGTQQKSSDASGNPQTSEERRVAVAQRLDESLGTFDATLHKEQADLAKAREQRADDAAKAADKGGEGVEDVKADAGVDPDKETAKNERRGGMKSEADTGKDSKGTSEDNGAAETGDVGQGHVDDIVGRQICEAAQRETDPELKEKLMKECKAYRDGTH